MRSDKYSFSASKRLLRPVLTWWGRALFDSEPSIGAAVLGEKTPRSDVHPVRAGADPQHVHRLIAPKIASWSARDILRHQVKRCVFGRRQRVDEHLELDCAAIPVERILAGSIGCFSGVSSMCFPWRNACLDGRLEWRKRHGKTAVADRALPYNLCDGMRGPKPFLSQIPSEQPISCEEYSIVKSAVLCEVNPCDFVATVHKAEATSLSRMKYRPSD
jgi:hypothetical protein